METDDATGSRLSVGGVLTAPFRAIAAPFRVVARLLTWRRQRKEAKAAEREQRRFDAMAPRLQREVTATRRRFEA